MNSPIALRPFDEDEYRERVRSLSDDDLVKEKKQLRSLCGGVVSAGPPCAFDIELKRKAGSSKAPPKAPRTSRSDIG